MRQNEAQRLREACLQKPAEKEAFKMTRYTNTVKSYILVLLSG